MDEAASPIRPSWAQLVAAVLVLVACELAMAACWFQIALVLPEAPELYLSVVLADMLLAMASAIFFYLQYQATFQHDRRAASAITVLLSIGTVLVSVAFLDLTAMLFGLGRFERGWYVVAAFFLLFWFAVVMNWRWSNQLRRIKPTPQPQAKRLNIATMLGVMTLLAVQFALARLFMHLALR